MTRLAERLAAAQGGPIDYDGRTVQMLYELPPVSGPGTLAVGLEPGAPRPQALRLKARGGLLAFGDQELDDVVLWTDTAPPALEIGLRPAGPRKPMVVRAWNAWRDHLGAMQAWIGDAGLVVEPGEDAGAVVLRCSDGYDEPSFGDLVVRLRVTPS